MRRARWAIAIGIAPAIMGCSLFVSLDDLTSGDAGAADAAAVDTSVIDSAVDAGADVATDAAIVVDAYLLVDPCVEDPADLVDLTSTGPLDWTHFAGAPGMPDQKSIATHILGELQQSPSGNQPYADDARKFSWSDGTTSTSVTGNSSGIFDERGPMVLQATAAADRRALTVYVDSFTANSQLDVSLSPGPSAPAQAFTSTPDATHPYRCAIHYSGPPGSILTVTWTLTSSVAAGADKANIAFAAATVAAD